MIYLKTEREISAIEKSNQIVAETLLFIEKYIVPGIDTRTINDEAEAFILNKNAKPAFKGLYGFPAAICISVNDEVVHGIPGPYLLKDGDIVGVDIGVIWNGYYGDAAKTYCAGNVSDKVRKLCSVTEKSLFLGINECFPSKRVGDISNAVQNHVELHGFSVVRDLVGHGVGIKPHEDPQVPNFGTAGTGPKLKAGMVIAIEPMVNMGTFQVYTMEDQWTIKTADGKPSAHFEHSVAILKNGPKILSKI
jgi:methionyl aminopeptidase